MTQPQLAVDTPRGRMYRLDPSSEPIFPSITTVSGMLNKPFLEGWRAKLAGERALEMYEFLSRNPHRMESEIHRIVGDKERSRRRISAAAAEYTARAASFGTFVHALCEQWAVTGSRPDQSYATQLLQATLARGEFPREKQPQDIIDQAQVRMDGYGAFLQDFSPEMVHIEQTVVNHTVGYAGTTDLIVRMGNALLSGDIKTSTSVHGDYALQGVAVCNAEELLHDDGTVEPMPELAGAFVIHLPKEGGYSIVPLNTSAKTWDVFKALRKAWDFEEPKGKLTPVRNSKELLMSVLRNNTSGIGS